MAMNINSVTKNVVANSYKISEKIKDNSKISEKNKEENSVKDIVTISLEATQKLEEEMSAKEAEKVEISESDTQATDAISEKAAEYSQLEANLENANKSAEGMADSYEAMRLAMQIAARMSKGVKVSADDEEFLMNFNNKMYMSAKSAQGIAQHQKDMSDETLSEEYSEKHSGDDAEAMAAATGPGMPTEAPVAEAAPAE